MGYKRQKKTYLLVFDDADMAGLEVRATSPSTGELIDLDALRTDMSGSSVTRLVGQFAAHLVSWNLEDDADQAVPPTAESLLWLDVDFLLPVIKAWFEAVAGADPTSRGGSPRGVSPVEASLPMETPSPGS